MTSEITEAERRILSEREALVAHIQELRSRSNITYVRRQALAAVAPSSSPVWPAVGRKIADHPVGFALTLAGLLYMAVGPEPAPPQEQIARLKKAAGQWRDKAADLLHTVEDAARPAVTVVPDAAARAKAATKSATSTIVDRAASALSSVRDEAGATIETVSESAADLTRKASEVGRVARREAVYHAGKAEETLSDNIVYVAAAAFAAGFAKGLHSKRSG
jgi:hypothetical protein